MFIRKAVHIILMLGLMLGYGILPASAVPILNIEPSSPVVQPGQSFSLAIDITDVTDLFSFQFDVAFNPSVLSATSVTEGPFLPTGGATFFIPGTIDNTVGAITFTSDTLIGTIPGVNDDGTLAAISFQALAPGTSPIILSNVILLDSILGDMTASIVDGSVTVVPEPSTLLLLATGLVGLLATGWRHRHRGK